MRQYPCEYLPVLWNVKGDGLRVMATTLQVKLVTNQLWETSAAQHLQLDFLV